MLVAFTTIYGIYNCITSYMYSSIITTSSKSLYKVKTLKKVTGKNYKTDPL